MSEIDYAFPFQPRHKDGTPMCAPEPGMTLRDYFAGQALSGYIAHLGSQDIHASGYAKECAVESYAFADAMLKARES
jgi:hypothetical protein